MNNSVFEGMWKQIRNQIKAWWDKLIEDDHEKNDSYVHEFIEQLRLKYGYTLNLEEDEYKGRQSDQPSDRLGS